MNHWLMKSEPDVFGIDDLASRPRQTEPWDGVRNYQARNFMRDDMKIGDPIFFYHSNCKVPGIVGLAEVASKPYPDPGQFDEDSKYFDPKSDPADPRWQLVDIRFVRKFKETVSLTQMKNMPELEGFRLVSRGNRLSVMPVEPEYWNAIMDVAE